MEWPCDNHTTLRTYLIPLEIMLGFSECFSDETYSWSRLPRKSRVSGRACPALHSIHPRTTGQPLRTMEHRTFLVHPLVPLAPLLLVYPVFPFPPLLHLLQSAPWLHLGLHLPFLPSVQPVLVFPVRRRRRAIAFQMNTSHGVVTSMNITMCIRSTVY